MSHVGFEKHVHVTRVLWARDIRRQAEEMAQAAKVITGKVWGHGWIPSSRVDKLAVVLCFVTPSTLGGCDRRPLGLAGQQVSPNQ